VKRPEGFDPPRAGAPAGDEQGRAPRRARKAAPEQGSASPTAARPVPPQAGRSTAPTAAQTPQAQRTPSPRTGAGAPKRPGGPLIGEQPEAVAAASKPARAAKKTKAPKQRTAEQSLKDARRRLKRAERRRRRFERGEVRRFTRRSRSRRTIVLTAAGLVVALLAVLAVAIYSPLLALKTITVDGASRVDAAQVTDAVDGQLGTPLALLDYGEFTRQLAEFPLIRSYVTEMVPPDTLIIHIVERAPVAAVQNGAVFDLVDPAGIVVQSSPERPDGVPLIDIGGQEPDSEAFTSVVAVLLALPEPLLAQVDSITASTQDDVTFVLRGIGQSVVWGSSDNSAYKASALAAMVAKQDPNTRIEYDVSAPGSVVVTQR
jgi:cell division protein FtsQ